MYSGTNLLLNSSCTIKRATETRNTKNQVVYSTHTDHATNVKCRLIIKSGNYIIDGKIAVLEKSVIYLPFATDIKSSDIISLNSKSYKPEFINYNPGNSSHHIEVEVKEVSI